MQTTIERREKHNTDIGEEKRQASDGMRHQNDIWYSKNSFDYLPLSLPPQFIIFPCDFAHFFNVEFDNCITIALINDRVALHAFCKRESVLMEFRMLIF